MLYYYKTKDNNAFGKAKQLLKNTFENKLMRF